MQHEDYKNLREEVKNKNFFNGYKIFSQLSYYLSFVGNFFSVFLAFFFINDVISQTVLDGDTSSTMVVYGITLTILFTVELVKRFIFDKFSMEIIKEKFAFKGSELKILSFFSLLLIFASFYLSLNGAKEYASKDKQIQETTTSVIDVYEDSLNSKYGKKIELYETEITLLRTANLSYDDRLKMLDEKNNELTVDNWKDRQEKRRIETERKNIRKDKDRNIEQMEKIEIKIKDTRDLKETELSKYTLKQETKAVSKIEENADNPMRFLIFSTIIEFVILFGIFFINYYKVRSLEEYENLVAKDPRYKTFNQWNELITMIYTKDTRLGDVLPFKTEMNKLIKANSLDFSTKELEDALKIFTHLGVLKKKGNRKAISMGADDARSTIREHFKIE